MRRLLFLVLGGCLFAASTPPTRDIVPAVETTPLMLDVDDPAIWIDPQNDANSLIVGTVKRAKPEGSLTVYNLNGEILETVGDLDRPNNVDILGSIAVTTERAAKQLRIYRVSGTKPHLQLLGLVPVFEGETGDAQLPMGIALYRRPKDKAIFAIVSRKTGPANGYLWEYRLHIEGDKARGEKVRALGTFSGNGEIEAVAVDQERGLVYYSDENCCVHVWHADPDAKGAGTEVAKFAQTGFQLNREGIAITDKYVIVTDQLDPRSEYHVFDRGSRKEVAVWRGRAQSTDGADATSHRLGPKFPRGALVVMNNAQHNFQLYRLE